MTTIPIRRGEGGEDVGRGPLWSPAVPVLYTPAFLHILLQSKEKITVFAPCRYETLIEATCSFKQIASIKAVGSHKLRLFKLNRVAFIIGRYMHQRHNEVSRSPYYPISKGGETCT